MIITLMITSQIPDNHHQAWGLPDFCPPCLDECTLCQLLFGSHLGYCGEMIRMLINHCNNNYILLYCCINFSHLGKNCSKILEEVVYELVSRILNPIQVLYLLNQLAWHCCTSSPIASTFPWASWAHSCQAKPTGRVSYAHLRQWIGKLELELDWCFLFTTLLIIIAGPRCNGSLDKSCDIFFGPLSLISCYSFFSNRWQKI